MLMRYMVEWSAAFQEEQKLPMEPFMLTLQTQIAPSTFETVFLIDGVQFRYGFTADETRIHAEWLFALTSTRESMYFTRESGNDTPNGIDVNKSKFKEGVGSEKQTGINQLFLSKVALNQGDIAKRIREFMVQQCIVVNAAKNDTDSYTVSRLHDNRNGYRDKIIELVRRMDVDILGLRVEQRELPQEARSPLIASRKLRGDLDEPIALRLLTLHRVRDKAGNIIGEAEYEFSEMTSDGTQKIIALAGPIVDALARGAIMFAVKLDSRLHPKMMRALLELFLSPETNPHNAQIIFATHDTNLLDRSLLRRDQIYFCEKEQDATRLYSLADFILPEVRGGSKHVRNDASFEKDYIEGRYGAIPYFGDLRGLFREEFAAQRTDPITCMANPNFKPQAGRSGAGR